MKEIQISSTYGTLSGSLYEGASNETLVVIASATGVKQEYYRKFAQFLANKGFTVITFDYNGIGRSLNKPLKELTLNAADWGRNDLEAVLQYVFINYPMSKKVILGHSIGGQLIGLAKSAEQVDKIVMVAAQSGYWKYWNGIGKLKMWFNWYILFPVILNMFGYLNAKKLSGMENLPKDVANQWRNWGKNKDYILSDGSIDEFYYDKIKVDIASFSIEDDEFAPIEATQWMTSQYQNAPSKHTHLRPVDFKTKKIGHFGVFKDQFKDSIWTVFFNEIKA